MKISVITPSYNQVQFIERTILSVLSQDHSDLEYIVMDGGSTDGTVEILEKYSDRIIWRSEKDDGQSDAINKGLRMATGDIVAFLNSDDTYEPDALSTVARFFHKYPDTQWVYGKCHIIDAQDREIRKPITWYKNLLLGSYSYPKLLSENFISQPATFWRRDLHAEIGYFNETEHFCMDYEFWLRIGSKYQAGVIDSYLANFRYYPTSKSGSVNKKQFQDELRIAKRYGRKHPVSLLLHAGNYYKITTLYQLMNSISKAKTTFKKVTLAIFRKIIFLLKLINGNEVYYPIQIKINKEYMGSDEYGGWYISPKSISRESVVYSFGIGEDISFDIDIIKKYGCNVFAFDPTPKSIEWLKKQILPSQFSYYDYGIAKYDGKMTFYPPENPAHISHSIIPKGAVKNAISVDVHKFSTIVNELKHTKVDILKMDIEGSEYEVLDGILNSQVPIQQILIEFHHRFSKTYVQKTKTAIEKLNDNGYKIFSISPTREEYSFIKTH